MIGIVIYYVRHTFQMRYVLAPVGHKRKQLDFTKAWKIIELTKPKNVIMLQQALAVYGYAAPRRTNTKAFSSVAKAITENNEFLPTDNGKSKCDQDKRLSQNSSMKN